jgi:hypothetical protein
MLCKIVLNIDERRAAEFVGADSINGISGRENQPAGLLRRCLEKRQNDL